MLPKCIKKFIQPNFLDRFSSVLASFSKEKLGFETAENEVTSNGFWNHVSIRKK